MTKAICEDCGSLVDAEITHNGVCEVGHYVHCGWGHMLSPSDLISDAAADRIEELEAKLEELLAVSKRAVRLSLDHADFKLYAMEPMHQAIAAAELKGRIGDE
jgi:hypothetical protein